MEDHLQRPSIGENAHLGTLYDARSCTFLPDSIFKRQYRLSKACVFTTSEKKIAVEVTVAHDTYGTILKDLKIKPDLGVSILAGLLQARGATGYLKHVKQNSNTLHAAVHRTVTTGTQELNLPELYKAGGIGIHALASQKATHFVVGVEWGIRSIVSFDCSLSGKDSKAVDDQFRADIKGFVSTVDSSHGSLQKSCLPSDQSFPQRLRITIYSDVFNAEGVIMRNMQDARHQLSLVSSHIEQEYSGRGRQIMYTLIPTHILGFMMGHKHGIGLPVVLPSHDILRKFIDIFDRFASTRLRQKEHHEFVSRNRDHLQYHVHEVQNRTKLLQQFFDEFRNYFINALSEVQNGTEGPDSLERLYETYKVVEDEISPIPDRRHAKMQVAAKAGVRGARVVESQEMMRNIIGDHVAYVFYVSDAAVEDSKRWEENCEFFYHILSQRDPHIVYIVADCDKMGRNLLDSQITLYHNGKTMTKDVVEQQQWKVENNLVECRPGLIETKNVERPLKRRLVRMPCPNSTCDPTKIGEWMCSECHAPVEFGFSDNYIYCDCGRSLYHNFKFKCKQEKAGYEFQICNQQHALSLLKGLEASNCVNILILGETGVGKSTFINAFVNYLTFQTLDDAKAAETLNWVIPCSFSTQVMNRSKPQEQIRQINIQIGSRDDETDGSKGASATQKTAVYPVMIGNRVIRLIDTPGIGDTRGLQYDKQNMADILATLSSYDDLHGIIILLKPNNSRLTVTFNFCMKELLTHLHRSAAHNMAFGFTNTRISNYTPGDTFGPLSTLLQEHSSIGFSLTTHTTYCFDLESFRYLAAFKNGIVMENEEDFRRSWQHSSAEAQRLVEYFQKKTPHKVQNTISLNGARQLISDLTKPMADIATAINISIALSEDKMAEIRDHKLTGDDLRKRLKIQRKHLRAIQLDMPRTVCKNSDCTEFQDDGSGEGKLITIYKTHCHPVCHLNDVKADQVAHPGIINCAAFCGRDHCTVCGHNWQEHLHVLYELEEYTAEVTDTRVEQELRANADDVTLREAAISDLRKLITEYKAEHAQIQEAAARFGLFLKKHSITPYNDATLAYLDMLIRDEEEKARAGGNRKRLDDLLEDRRRHVELVDVLARNMDNAYDARFHALNEGGVARVVEDLYRLKHFGENLKTIKNSISEAHLTTNRERPFRVDVNKKGARRNDRMVLHSDATTTSSRANVKTGSKGSDARPKGEKMHLSALKDGGLVKAFTSMLNRHR